MRPQHPKAKTVLPLSTLALLLALSLSPTPSSAQLRLSRWHYSRTCPQAESIVYKHMRLAHDKDPRTSPALLRLFFHDCFVRGCDASVLLTGKPGKEAEMAGEPNLTLDGYDVINGIKAELETVCPGIVSCADIIALTARDSVQLAKGPRIPMLLGRKDGGVSVKAQANRLPSSQSNASTLIRDFAEQGLSVEDLVALSGAHTFGMGRCVRLTKRFPPNVDSNLNIQYRNKLMRDCKAPNIAFEAEVENDPVSPDVFDNEYFKLVLRGQGLFTSDAVLKMDPRTLPWVTRFAADQQAFFNSFGRALARMGQIGIARAGEIRKVCHKVNAAVL